MNEYTTARLRVRHLEERDLDAIYRVVYSDPEVCRFFCGKTRPKEQVRAWLPYRAYQSRHEPWGLMVVEITDTAEIIGLVGIQPNAVAEAQQIIEDDPYNRPGAVEVELSYVFGKAYWGQGFAAEACVPMIEYAFREVGLDRLVTGCDPLNTRAAGLQTKLGMRKVRNVHPNADEGWLIGILDNPYIAAHS